MLGCVETKAPGEAVMTLREALVRSCSRCGHAFAEARRVDLPAWAYSERCPSCGHGPTDVLDRAETFQAASIAARRLRLPSEVAGEPDGADAPG